MKRLKIRIEGAVQGVGFRPFVWRLATELGLFGSVMNGVEGVVIEADGNKDALEVFLARLISEIPPLAKIEKISHEYSSPAGFKKFEIIESDSLGEKTALVMPDVATCPDCLREISDPANRRFRYPFTNCTNCGPRFTIIEKLPYDRANTSMKHFPMCPLCFAEYKNPADRRFHAEPTACPVCGPRLELLERNGKISADRGEALFIAETILWNGGIIALKGLGGFQILTDARNKESVSRLREAKGRPGQKPFAVMYESIESVKEDCFVSPEEEKLLTSREAPIVLLERKPFHKKNSPCSETAPESNTLGVMLPYTPLHHVLMNDLGFPVVATSGNISDEPIVTEEKEALRVLGNMCDVFLVHNRGITQHADDSIARVVLDKPIIMRRARGYTPLPIVIPNFSLNVPRVVAFGPHLKNTGGVNIGEQVFLTQHMGDMETVKSSEALQKSVREILSFREKTPEAVACDLHPDYVSTRLAKSFSREFEIPLTQVQHHEAHVLSCMAENEILEKEVLGVAWDGTGFGTDGMSWGGEFFHVRKTTPKRIGYLLPFALIGGDGSAREPKRIGVALLYEIFGCEVFGNETFAPILELTQLERKIFPTMLRTKTGIHRTTSVGRLFDGVASILNICHSSSYEGHAAMMLEQTALRAEPTDETYHFEVMPSTTLFVVDWKTLIKEILSDIEKDIAKEIIAAKFHNTLANMIVAIAVIYGETNVALSGGCFQNKYLLETTLRKLTKVECLPFFHSKVPTNDGGIALGQIVSALLQQTDKR